MLDDFFLIGGEFCEHFFVFLFLFFGEGLHGGFFSHLNDYYKRDQQYKSINRGNRWICYGYALEVGYEDVGSSLEGSSSKGERIMKEKLFQFYGK